MSTAWVVTGTQGMYSDKCWWVVAVHKREADAKAHVTNAHRYARKMWIDCVDPEDELPDYGQLEIMIRDNPWDTKMLDATSIYGSEPPEYSCEEVPWPHPMLEDES